MPKLPTYEVHQVQPQAAPSGAMSIKVPDLVSPIAQGLQNVSDVWHKEQMNAANMAAMAQLNEFNKFKNDELAKFKALQGQDVFMPDADGRTASERMASALKSKSDELSGALSGAAKELFSQHTAKESEGARASVKLHQVDAQMKFEDDTIDRSVELRREEAALDPLGEAATGKSIRSGYATLLDYFTNFKKLPAKDAEVMARAGVAGIASDTVTSLFKTNPAEAKKYLEEHKDKIDGKTYSALYERVRVRTRDEEIVARVDEISVMPLKDEEKIAIVRKEFKSTEERSSAMSQLELGMKQANVYDSESYGSIIDDVITNKMSTAAARSRVKHDTKLTPEGRLKIDAELLSIDEHRIARAKADKQDREADRNAFNVLITSEQFPSLTREEVLRAAKTLGPQYGQAVMTEWRNAQATGASQYRVPDVVKSGVIARLGYKAEAKMPEADKTALYDAIQQINDEVTAGRTGTGKWATKPPTQQEIAAKLMLKMKKVRIDSGHWYARDEMKRVVDMTQEDVLGAQREMGQEKIDMVRAYLGVPSLDGRNFTDVLQAADEIEVLKLKDPAAYNALFDKAFPGKRDQPVRAGNFNEKR